jgi:signal transduction histidine kinase/CheY-like chemotaxis protein
LSHGDQKLIYDLHYYIFKKQDIGFTKKILNILILVYSYLYTESKTDKERLEINGYLNKITDILLIQRYSYLKKLDDQAKTSQNILIYISNRLDHILNTQELMIANISHEMHTSLNAIYGYLSIIERNNVLSGEEKYYLQKAHHATKSLQSLVKDILNVTKINSGQLEIQEEFFWLDSMLIRCIDNLSMELKEKKGLSFEVDSDFYPEEVYGDQAHIIEILVNLLSNAFKYTQKGHIRFSMKCRRLKKGVEVVFSVKDTGIGMTPEQIENIFSPYSRFNMKEQGLGLGLHITKQLSDKLNGKLVVTSEPNKGSTFGFSIIFQRTKKPELDLSGVNISAFIDRKERKNIDKRLHLLKEMGAEVKEYGSEVEFISHLLNINTKAPKVVLISTESGDYSKFDALDYYLKTTRAFKNTFFIAENIKRNCSLKYFDEIYEHFSPIGIFEKLAITEESGKEKSRTKLSILAVDDIETNLDIFRLFLLKKYPNIDIDFASGGYEAIGMSKIKKYDLIFLDLKMPGLNGFEVLKKLKELGPTPPVYAFSADIYKSNYEKIREYGFTGLLQKPLEPEKLYKIIDKIARQIG